MKTNIVCFILILINIFLRPVIGNSNITEVTVYQSQARITREATVSVSPGTSEIILSNLEHLIQQNSLQVKVEGAATLLSATTRINYLADREQSIIYLKIRDSLQVAEGQLKRLKAEKTVFLGEEKIIHENTKLGGTEDGVQVNELKMFAEFYRIRLMDIKKQVLFIDTKENEFEEIARRLRQQLDQINRDTKKPVGELVLQLASNAAGKVKVQFNYLVTGAGWVPLYDIRTSSLDKPVELVFKANVYQSTGYHWKGIRLSLSTRNPQADQNRPVLVPWYIDFFQEVLPRHDMHKSMAISGVSNVYQEIVADDEMEAVAAPEYVVTTTEGMVATEFVVENPQTITSTGKEHLVSLITYQVPAQFTYHTVPKLSDGVFLLAKLTDYGPLNLLPGNASLFNQGMYVGTSYLNPLVAADTLLVSLGRDEKVSVKKELLVDLTSRQVIGPNIREIKSFTLTVKNNKREPVLVEVLDNIPIPRNREIEVSLDESSGAIYKRELGSLLWYLQLNPGESRQLRFSFTVKYPKDKRVTGI